MESDPNLLHRETSLADCDWCNQDNVSIGHMVDGAFPGPARLCTKASLAELVAAPTWRPRRPRHSRFVGSGRA